MTDGERDAFDVRPTGDEMLARVQAAAGDGRGRLRVYVGMAPGVGKTYRMLEEAHRRLDRGTDIVVGYVEAHERPRTIEMLEGLEVVPRRGFDYRGVAVEEMDTDAILTRRPTVVLVDELAHTNVPGSARAKRWEDIDVIRDAGIHVISTCNVQHLASMADAVATITGAPVHERVPDDVLDDADEVELVDMSPHALRQRMRHGNVYPPDRTRLALEHFFTESNLTALRELALRFVARSVDDQLDEMGAAGGASPSTMPAVAERILVVVDESSASRRALRRAASLAGALHAPLIALVVETPMLERLASNGARDLRENVDFAVDLGATVVRTEAADLVSGVTQVARVRRATRLVLPFRETGTIAGFARRSTADEILRRMPELEIHLVADPGAGGQPA